MGWHDGRPIWDDRVVEKPTTPFYVENINNFDIQVDIQKSDDVAPTIPVEYSFDKTTWQSLGSTSTTAISVTVPAGRKVWLRAKADTWCVVNLSAKENIIKPSNKCSIGGNIMSLLYGAEFTGEEREFPTNSNHNFCEIFSTQMIQDASKLLLPATTLTPYCYCDMFKRCTSLTSAPALPATTLADSCYSGMFLDCTYLTTTPVLPAITATRRCYQYMFYGCTSLTSASALHATTLAEECYLLMFGACTSLITAPILPATTLTQGCYAQMFNGCTSLTTAPILPATTLVEKCYRRMFYRCSNLNYIKCLATDVSASDCTTDWVNNVLSTGTFTKKAGASWPTGTSGIPEGWTVVEE